MVKLSIFLTISDFNEIITRENFKRHKNVATRKSTKTLGNQRRNGQGRMSNNNNTRYYTFSTFFLYSLTKAATTTTTSAAAATTCITPLPTSRLCSCQVN